MKVIPVLDIMGGKVVHAKGGRRDKYRPLKSVLCLTPDPVSLSLKLRELGFKEAYVADLDAIAGADPSFSFYSHIRSRSSLDLMVDAGISSLDDVSALIEGGVSKAVIGTETLRSLEFVRRAVEQFGSERIVVSLDVKKGNVVGGSELISSMEPVSAAKNIELMGVTDIIVLDLDRVGSGGGVNLQILRQILNAVSAGIKVYVGGGVKDFSGLLELNQIGVFGALVATALHKGVVKVDGLKAVGFM